MLERIRQELAAPNVVHFYTWLLRSMLSPPERSLVCLQHFCGCHCSACISTHYSLSCACQMVNGHLLILST